MICPTQWFLTGLHHIFISSLAIFSHQPCLPSPEWTKEEGATPAVSHQVTALTSVTRRRAECGSRLTWAYGPQGAAAQPRNMGAAAQTRRVSAFPRHLIPRQPATRINYKPAFNVSDSLNGIFHSNFVIKIERPFGCDHTSIINCICLRY